MGEAAEKEGTRLALALGLALTALVCAATVAADYAVKIFDVEYSELLLLYGGSTLLVYGAAVVLKAGWGQMFPAGTRRLQAVYIFVGSLGPVAGLLAVKLMPMGDVVILKFSAPVPSFFFSICLIKEAPSLLKLMFCLLLVVGDTLVLQPPFLFGSKEESESAGYPLYWLGFVLASTFAVQYGLVSVLVRKFKLVSGGSVTPSHLLFQGSLSVTAFSLGLLACGWTNRVLTGPGRLRPAEDVLPLAGCVLLLHVKFLALMHAARLLSPVLFTSLRTAEILLVLAIELAFYGRAPGGASWAGVALAVASIVAIAAHDQIAAALPGRVGRGLLLLLREPKKGTEPGAKNTQNV